MPKQPGVNEKMEFGGWSDCVAFIEEAVKITADDGLCKLFRHICFKP